MSDFAKNLNLSGIKCKCSSCILKKRKGGEISSQAVFMGKWIQALMPSKRFNAAQINIISKHAYLKCSPYFEEKKYLMADLMWQGNNACIFFANISLSPL